ncbi:hypothetical protein QJS66_19150 [Kocuria rhizophila]|nr:hypothetical protein QJS66_19150 [Kocuria rhizophila]
MDWPPALLSRVIPRRPETAPAPAGRFAPSPSGDLHRQPAHGPGRVGFRTRHRSPVPPRVEDLDRVKRGAAERNVADLRAIGRTWTAPWTAV